MTIFGIFQDDILGDLKRKDHIVFSLNMEGVHDMEGYGFVRTVAEEFCSEFKGVGPQSLGTVISAEADEHHCTFHGIVNHSILNGWMLGDSPRDCSYQATEAALDAIIEKYDDGEQIVRPIKSLYLGRGKMRAIGARHVSLARITQSMANSDADLALYVLNL